MPSNSTSLWVWTGLTNPLLKKKNRVQRQIVPFSGEPGSDQSNQPMKRPLPVMSDVV